LKGRDKRGLKQFFIIISLLQIVRLLFAIG